MSRNRVTARSTGVSTLHCDIGVLLHDSGHHIEAVAHFKRATTLAPRDPRPHCGLGRSLFALGMVEDAAREFSAALAANRDTFDVHNNLGACHYALGQFDHARAAFQTALSLRPESGTVHWNLANIKQFSGGDPQISAMEALLQNAAASESIPLHYALGKAYGDLDDRGRSFQHFATGSLMKRRTLKYDERAMLTTLSRITDVFASRAWLRHILPDSVNATPIFVVGMPRSGTTLVEQILASHPDCHGRGELPHIEQIAYALSGDTDLAGFPAAAVNLTRAALREMRSTYLQRAAENQAPSIRVVDKATANALFVGLIVMLFPTSPIVYVHRDPVDTCLSCFTSLFSGESQPFTYDLAELGRYCVGHQRLMSMWRDTLPPGALLDLPYERLVADFETQVRVLLSHCGLAWHPQCLRFHETRRAVQTASAVQVRRPLYASSVGRSRSYRPYLDRLLESLATPAQHLHESSQ